MKQLFFIGAIVALASCGGESHTDIKIMGVETPLQSDSLTRLNVDSIANVSDLPDTLTAY